MDYTLNVRGRLFSLAHPAVMGIMNVTPDSFYADSRVQDEPSIVARAHQIVAEGAAIIDVGACSTRPGSEMVSEAEEMARLRRALPLVRAAEPNAIISVDTFRPDVARMVVGELGTDIINDVGAGNAEAEADDTLLAMFDAVAELRVPYILMSRESCVHDMLITWARQVQALRDRGQKDILLDPGIGFGKTRDEEFTVLRELDKLLVMELPLLVGLSRKRVVAGTLGVDAAHALNGTTVLNTVALMHGASVLRVHDVKAAVEAVELTQKMQS